MLIQLIQLRLNLGCSDHGCEQLKQSIAQLSTWGSAFPAPATSATNSVPIESISCLSLLVFRGSVSRTGSKFDCSLMFLYVSRCQRKYTTYQDLSYSRSDRLARDAFFQHLLRAGGPRRPECCVPLPKRLLCLKALRGQTGQSNQKDRII
jgi:hypothetical protein